MRVWPALLIGGLDPSTDSVAAGATLPAGNTTPFDLVQAALLDFDVSAIEQPSPDSCRAFFATASMRDRAAVALRDQFPECRVESNDVPDDDWAARSQANLRAIQVGGIVVAPPWDASVAPTDSILVVIQPSMGFGTGHHATTRLCLAAMQTIDLHGLSAIDVGTGSGVLAIAAARLGATPVLGIDDDADAITAARENASLNPDAEVVLDLGDIRLRPPGHFDVVLANLTGGLLAAAAPRLQDLASPGGRLILSGFMDHEDEDVLRAFSACSVERRDQEDEWRCLTLATR